ncbi:MarR family winged helix-turn-helix transcriptional regulator [Micromonospora soli]|uniref:MarR family winged helix-turn-helix transcriptional regulator n=1 Tax=Micromonospora sp. NBRC 110009 TaxID=3061627 RepID=UPI0026723C30|nr:MarR family winged helix-turn-helix transcriptional regulator [Micromonospora sp. NBRC 110009]WKT97343.1 MarR family winged helix-turn-helix transcriptional regulator [Micromonospora sp. NBRC 110009]
MNPATRELGMRLYDLLTGVRLLKQHRAHHRPAVPPGLVGMLRHIDRCATGCQARELADRTRLDPSTVSRAVAALVADGLVERHADPSDRRASRLTLSEAGRTALTDTQDWYGQVLARALADWTPGEVAALSAALGRFTRDLEVALARHDNLEDAR